MSRSYNLSKSQVKVLECLKTQALAKHNVNTMEIEFFDENCLLCTCDLIESQELVERGLIKRLYGQVFIATQLEMF